MERWVDKLWVDVGEAGKLALVDIRDDHLVWWGQDRLGASEEPVKVLRSSAALQRERRGTINQRQ